MSVGCAASEKNAGAQQTSLPDGLVVLPGATKVRVATQNSGTVLYNMSEAYPAPDTIRQLNARLTEKGWQPLRKDVLNPSLDTSFDRPWGEAQVRSNSGGLVERFQWIGQWQDSAGNVAAYTLNYDGVVDSSRIIRPVGPLRMSAARLSPSQIRKIRDPRTL